MEQIGYRKGSSTLDHAIVLSHLIQKYTKKAKSKLFVAFLDLKAAFDSVNRELLWEKLEAMHIEKNLLRLIQRLYTNTSCQIRLSQDGRLSEEISTNMGVKQGCILAPTLFNLFLNDLAPCLEQTDGHPPKLGGKKISLLLYADDAVLLSQTRRGLRNLINKCLTYLSTNKLHLNYKKSKIVVFSKTWSPSSWTFPGGNIEQVKSYKYLGIYFSYNNSWTHHRKAVINSTRSSSSAILRFFFSKGGQYIPAAIKVFKAKTISQILYGIPVWMKVFNSALEQLQASFLRKILGLPNCVTYAALCLETGQSKIETLAWLHVSRFWLKLHFNLDTNNLLHLLLKDSQAIADYWVKEMKKIGIWLDILGASSTNEAFRIVKLRLMDIQLQELKSAANRCCSPLYLQIPVAVGKIPSYLALVDSPHLRRALSLARCNVLPSAVLRGRFNGVPFPDRLCSCLMHEIETLEHSFFHCPRYSEVRRQLFDDSTYYNSSLADATKLRMFLDSNDKTLIHKVAIFLNFIVNSNQVRQIDNINS